MPEIDSKIKSELNTRKEILNKHLTKFNQLKNECKWSEAWNQLLITLNYANETLAYSANLLKNISWEMPDLSAGQRKRINAILNRTVAESERKMIVIPKYPRIH